MIITIVFPQKTKWEQKVMANVSRFFDEIAKEAKMKFNNDEDMKVYEIEKIVRIKREASEANRREMEIQKRKMQEECASQVITHYTYAYGWTRTDRSFYLIDYCNRLINDFLLLC